MAAGEFTGDGKAEVVTGAGPGGGPDVQVFNTLDLSAQLASFYAYAQTMDGGVRVAAVDADGSRN